MLLEVGNALFSRYTTFVALESERLGDNSDGQGSLLACNLRDDRACTSAGTSAHTCRDEDHIRAFKRLIEFLGVLFGGFRSYAWIATRPEATGKLIANTNIMR